MINDEFKQQLYDYHDKGYLHFDFPISDNEKGQLIANLTREKVITHRFLPFISFEMKFKKYQNNPSKLTNKNRKISLPAHHDALIYKAYSLPLASAYEAYVNRKEISEIAIAYRSKKHMSNITGAKEVEDFICNQDRAWIIKGDFKHFFDNISHDVLKKSVKTVLADDYGKDWEKVLYSLINRKTIKRSDITKNLKLAGIVRPFRHGKQRAYVKNLKQLGYLIKQGNLTPSKKENNNGIPQGTAISAILANVSMIFFDESIRNLVLSKHGLYRRYSDDFVIVIPGDYSLEEVKKLKNTVIEQSERNLGLEIEDSKTKLLEYVRDEKNVQEISPRVRASTEFDYLGFSFDGKNVRLRSKGVYKFVYKGRKAINKLVTIERDRYHIQHGTELVVTKVLKYSRHSSKRWRDRSFAEQERYLKRIERERQDKDSSVYGTVHKQAVQMYLSMEEKMPAKSMLAYAIRAQKIFDSTNHPEYEVKVKQQILHQIRKNQLKLGQSRKLFKN
ncbi:reverse transcriptase/maturase family protein [Furfurilactobacillus siliginis]|nr:reverse transcriptase/maturase family protein [Furfurilactobacillus siliginis]GEK29150.1 hypothetical protein LSI01_14610 [Furfurilactobacillus siliginis]